MREVVRLMNEVVIDCHVGLMKNMENDASKQVVVFIQVKHWKRQ